jgi:NADH-quinone oxidoreductase subunit I
MAIKTKLNFLERLYFPEIFRGISITTRHFIKNISNPFKNPVTIRYPDEERPIHPRWRGQHRLMKREDDSIKCVACMCCATVCPARCITITPEEHHDPTIMKRAASFDIDMSRCVFCGFCAEACPVDAIRMDTGLFSVVDYGRDGMQFDKDRLLDTKVREQ